MRNLGKNGTNLFSRDQFQLICTLHKTTHDSFQRIGNIINVHCDDFNLGGKNSYQVISAPNSKCQFDGINGF